MRCRRFEHTKGQPDSEREVVAVIARHHPAQAGSRGNRVARAEAERANAPRADSSPTMSHELRTPLQCVIGSPRCSARKRAEFRRCASARYAELIKRSRPSPALVVNGILDMSQNLRQGTLRSRRPFSPRQAIEDLFAGLLASKRANLGLNSRQSGGRAADIVADKRALQSDHAQSRLQCHQSSPKSAVAGITVSAKT